MFTFERVNTRIHSKRSMLLNLLFIDTFYCGISIYEYDFKVLKILKKFSLEDSKVHGDHLSKGLSLSV